MATQNQAGIKCLPLIYDKLMGGKQILLMQTKGSETQPWEGRAVVTNSASTSLCEVSETILKSSTSLEKMTIYCSAFVTCSVCFCIQLYVRICV